MYYLGEHMSPKTEDCFIVYNSVSKRYGWFTSLATIDLTLLEHDSIPPNWIDGNPSSLVKLISTDMESTHPELFI